MKATLTWEDKIVDKENNPVPVYDVAIKNDGSQVLVAAGTHILVYDSRNGSVSQSLKQHSQTVFSVDYSFDDKYFASGAGDKMVLIWDSTTHEVVSKYNQGDTLQIVRFNPITNVLASCSFSDFAFWMSDTKTSTRFKVIVTLLVDLCSWDR